MKRLFIALCIHFSYAASAQSYDSCLRWYGEGLYEKVVQIYRQDTALQNRVAVSADLLDAVTTSLINLGEYRSAKLMLRSWQPAIQAAPPTLPAAMVLNNLGLIYDGQLDYDSALYALNSSLRIRASLVSKNDLLLAESYYNLGSLFSRMGEYDEAEEMLLKALSIEEKNYEPNDASLGMTLNNLAVVNEDCGRLQKALTFYRRASSIFAVSPGTDSFQFGLLQFNQAKILIKLNQIDSGDFYLSQANEVLSKAGIQLPEFGMLRVDQVQRLLDSPQWPAAEQLLQKTETEWLPHAEAYHYMLPHLLMCKAKLSWRQGNMNEALSKMDLAKKEFLTIHQPSHLSFAGFLDFEARLLFLQANFRKCHSSYAQLHKLMFTKIGSTFPSFSEPEREQFFEKVKPHFEKYATLLLVAPSQKGIASQLYNNQLATKAILLNYTNRWKRQLLRSGDFELIRSFTRWQEIKTQLEAELKKPIQQQLPFMDSLKEEVNSLEKALVSRSELFARHIDFHVSTWQEIQDSLKQHEAAIEIIRFRKFDYVFTNRFTNSIFYVALIVTKKTKSDPEIVLLSNGNELEDRAIRQYRNAILFKQQDKESYDKFWEPIRAHLPGIGKVYLSTDGIFNLINFNTLQNPRTGKYLLDEIEFRQVTNTRDLLIPANEETFNTYALLFGAPDYHARKQKHTNPELVFRTYRATRLVRDENFRFLPGAKQEVEAIRDLFEEKHWKVDLFEGQEAMEENLKHSHKPKVLHIATHGYFQKDESEDSGQRGSNDLLHRSGLMFAGAAESYGASEEIMDLSTHEDGVLTAFEATNLNLENTELVVLSACETGLGELKNGEGVYGLQRAFRVAGARNLIMSLWKVDDEVTRLLMESFYRGWLETNDKYGALRTAQQSIKARYPQPFFWGAFILVGN